ncbi:M15 family metallopeptidase [Shinella sp. CPCC 101442]|uniref:M15 family metallopeptidase n=1 Tax=Shinella sp. CPCC 101442 TaxID=2932265 RepID=UPI0021535D83|nr:M15 family metallopeptidase [Shinella sp. CPCC 101442]MCR6499671.1 M15 family metallopeptidase [Shinella sp. CPCC 101442]
MSTRRLLAGVAALLLAIPAARAAEPDLAARLKLLVEAYPESLSGIEGNRLLFKDGGPPLEIDDGKAKDHQASLASGDVEDSLRQIYPLGACEKKPEADFDPGRIRSDALMMRLYGASAKAVGADLVPVKWFGETLRVTKRQGAAAALEKVRDDLAAKSELKRYLSPSAGVFNWRKVSGAKNMSVHSFGAAVDLNTKFADYWIWSGGKPGKVPKYANKYPLEIVEIFERHGFVWGGRWYHYDTMHFEYRPELIAIARAADASACR